MMVDGSYAYPPTPMQVKNSILYINGEPQDEEFIAEGPAYTWGPSKVPDVSILVRKRMSLS